MVLVEDLAGVLVAFEDVVLLLGARFFLGVSLFLTRAHLVKHGFGDNIVELFVDVWFDFLWLEPVYLLYCDSFVLVHTVCHVFV